MQLDRRGIGLIEAFRNRIKLLRNPIGLPFKNGNSRVAARSPSVADNGRFDTTRQRVDSLSRFFLSACEGVPRDLRHSHLNELDAGVSQYITDMETFPISGFGARQ